MDIYLSDAPPPGALSAPLSTGQDVLSRVDLVIRPAARIDRSLWLFFLDRHGVQLPVVVPIHDVPDRPDPLVVGNLCGIIGEVLENAEPDGSAVLAFIRPGSLAVTQSDRHWEGALRGNARESGVDIRMLCLATPAGVRQLAAELAFR